MKGQKTGGRRKASKNKSENQPAAKVTKEEPAADDPGDHGGKLKVVGGSRCDSWNGIIVNQTIRSLWRGHSDAAMRHKEGSAIIGVLACIGPKDELEGMMAAQLIAAHNAAMECYRRAMLSEQTFEGCREALTQANKLSRTYATLLEALNHHRGKGQQKVTVEHVTVNAGGQAVVGTVEAPGGDGRKSKDQPHAQQIGHAPQPAMWSADEERQAMPVARDAEWPMPDARRTVAGGSQRQQECTETRPLLGRSDLPSAQDCTFVADHEIAGGAGLRAAAIESRPRVR